MKRYLIIIFVLLLSAVAMSQNTKKVAVMETKKITDEVTLMQSLMVRGGLETAAANAPGYEVYDRTSFDAIMSEQNFQRSGAVSDSQIKKLGEMAGVQYVVVSEAAAEGNDLYILVKMLDVETGKFGAAYNRLCSKSSADISKACDELGAQLFGSGQRTGELQLPEGRYVGDILDGKPHGQGIIYYKPDDSEEKVSYEGSWVNGEREGYGTMIWKDGRKYEGNWKNDKKDGYGTQYGKSGGKYVGNWKEGKLDGQGTLYYDNGRKAYEGNFKEGKLDGQGTGYYEDGRKKYEGNWKDNGFDGQGTRYWENGDKYVGNFKDGRYDGFGTYYWSDGEKFVGNWKDNKRNGQGTDYFTDGARREGTWTDGKKNGSATYYYSDGRIEYERWVNDVKQ